MSKKVSKFLLFTAVAGAAVYGTYAYLQKKEKNASPVADDEIDDDFDDFSEDLDEDPASEKDRSYVSLNLDKAEALASEAFQKAKEVITDSMQQVKETVKSVADSQVYHNSFTDLTQNVASRTVDAEAKELSAEASEESSSTAKETASEVSTQTVSSTSESNEADEKVEEFFDDED